MLSCLAHVFGAQVMFRCLVQGYTWLLHCCGRQMDPDGGRGDGRRIDLHASAAEYRFESTTPLVTRHVQVTSLTTFACLYVMPAYFPCASAIVWCRLETWVSVTSVWSRHDAIHRRELWLCHASLIIRGGMPQCMDGACSRMIHCCTAAPHAMALTYRAERVLEHVW